MITIVFRMVIKKEKLAEFQQLVTLLTVTTREKDAGCLLYDFYQNASQKNEYLLYEKWKDKTFLDKHLARLRALLGPADPGKILSRKLNDCFASTEDVYYHES
ncbi:MAG: Antibiotic biosynthesis monooxygenase [Candidatus Gottesmanbacteria bacterium GW2011_GWA1_42_26]|nr:MAG: Antibiotic biosynthesis monooxygenase [Candidatus Gottesmanbacteria bacterium GW2011_GWA1_42_26]